MRWSSDRSGVLVGMLLLTIPSAVNAQPEPIIETGFQVGAALGVEGPHFSNYQGVVDVGFLFTGEANTPVRFGITGYAALGDDDLLLGIKSRFRITYGEDWSSDLGAGMILATAEGGSSSTRFIASHSLNHGWLSLRAETTVRSFSERLRFVGTDVLPEEDGTELGLYWGVALRETPGWIGAGLGATAALLYYGIDLISDPPS